MTSIFLFSSSSIVGTNIYCEFKYARHWTEKLTHFISWNHLNYFLMWSDYSPLCIIKNTESKGNSIPSVQFSAAAQLCLTLCDPMDCGMPGFPIHHQLLELVQTHVHWVGDAIQPSHPLSSPSPPTFNLSQHQDLFLESVLCIMWEFQLYHQSFHWIFRTDFL